MSNDTKTMEDVRNLIVCDTQFGWTGSTTLRLQQMLDLQKRGWLAEGSENNEFDLTDVGREVVARALQGAVQPTLADVQPGGRVMLGDALRPCPFCGHSYFDQWPCEYIDASGANVVRCARCHAAAPMKVWHALSAQPSPGGQDVLTSELLAHAEGLERMAADDRETGLSIEQAIEDGEGYTPDEAADIAAGLQHDAERGEETAALLRKAATVLAARQPVTMDDALAAGDGTLHGAIDHWQERALRAEAELAARQPVGRSFQAGVAEWMGQCFLPSLYSNMTERGDRLLEEVLELLQAHDYDSARVATLVDYVFGRPVGEPAQEVGGVMVTLAGYCWVAGLDMHAAGDAELARINQPDAMAKIRAKQEAKNALHFDTPLPGDPAATDAWPREGDLVRYGDGASALAIRLEPHAGGWHGYQCCGGYTFFTKAYRPSRADMDTWLDCAKYRDGRTKVADNRVAHQMYLLDSQEVGNG